LIAYEGNPYIVFFGPQWSFIDESYFLGNGVRDGAVEGGWRNGRFFSGPLNDLTGRQPYY